MGGWYVNAVGLPAGKPVEFWTENDRISFQPVAGAEALTTGGYVLPGLVDAHTHPGAQTPRGPLDEILLRKDLEAHGKAGVTALRVAGAPRRLPAWAARASDLPRVVGGSPWLFTPGMFFAGWGREVSDADLASAAVEEALAGDGWVKLRGDFIVDEVTYADPPLLAEQVLCETVQRVHAVGGRVAIHATHAEACRRAVAAGVDSLEHRLWLDHALLPTMAVQGTALTPTHTVWARQLEAIRNELRSPAREWFLEGYARLGPLTVAADAAGVTILAGTDSRPQGSIAEEVRHMVAGGLPASVALGAACWRARAFFGLPGIEHGAPSDFVIFDRDPLEDLDVLAHPTHVVLNGRLLNGRYGFGCPDL